MTSNYKYRISFFFLTLISCLSLISCDVMYFAQVVNNSNRNVTVQIRYDKDEVLKIVKANQLTMFLENSIRTDRAATFDTINLITTTEVFAHDSLWIDHGRGFSPRFDGIKKITISGTETIELKTKDAMLDAFKKKNNLYILEIN